MNIIIVDESGGVRVEGLEFAKELEAFYNFCQLHGIDPKLPDPLKVYRETVCKEQRELCAHAVQNWLPIKYVCDAKNAILTADPPKAKEPKPRES